VKKKPDKATRIESKNLEREKQKPCIKRTNGDKAQH